MKKCPFCAEDIQDAAIVCKHCGRDLKGGASQVQIVAPKKKTSLVTWVILGFIVFIALAQLPRLMFSTPATPALRTAAPAARTAPPAAPVAAQTATARPQSTATAESARRAKASRELIPDLVKQGLIKRMDVKTGKFYIDGTLWEGFELDAKQNLVKMMSWYREAEYKGLPQVTLYESRNGKELASYGAFSGVTIQ